MCTFYLRLPNLLSCFVLSNLSSTSISTNSTGLWFSFYIHFEYPNTILKMQIRSSLRVQLTQSYFFNEFVNPKIVKTCILFIFLYLANISPWDWWPTRSFVCCSRVRNLGRNAVGGGFGKDFWVQNIKIHNGSLKIFRKLKNNSLC